MNIASRLAEVKAQLSDACRAAGRPPEAAQLLAVSKTQPIEAIRAAFDAGQRDFGENRAQEMRDKHELLPDARWHMIGHLQRNKVKYIAPFVHLIHSVDDPELLAEISHQAEKHGRSIDCLLQLNISHEAQKSGMEPETAQGILRSLDQYPQVRILGLMGMAELSENRERIRAQFRALAQHLQEFQSLQHPRLELTQLSMGMSGDYDLAIAEGATWLRIGTAIFGERNYPA